MNPIISTQAQTLICEQVSHELHNELQYRAFGAYAANLGLARLAAYFMAQADDEHAHAQKFMGYLDECNCPLAVPAVAAPLSMFIDLAEVADLRFMLEMQTTDQIDALMALAMVEDDYGLQDLMQWFCRQQKEERTAAARLVSLVKLSGGNALLLELAFKA